MRARERAEHSERLVLNRLNRRLAGFRVDQDFVLNPEHLDALGDPVAINVDPRIFLAQQHLFQRRAAFVLDHPVKLAAFRGLLIRARMARQAVNLILVEAHLDQIGTGLFGVGVAQIVRNVLMQGARAEAEVGRADRVIAEPLLDAGAFQFGGDRAVAVVLNILDLDTLRQHAQLVLGPLHRLAADLFVGLNYGLEHAHLAEQAVDQPVEQYALAILLAHEAVIHRRRGFLGKLFVLFVGGLELDHAITTEERAQHAGGHVVHRFLHVRQHDLRAALNLVAERCALVILERLLFEQPQRVAVAVRHLIFAQQDRGQRVDVVAFRGFGHAARSFHLPNSSSKRGSTPGLMRASN